jgi:hypothetical protein
MRRDQEVPTMPQPQAQAQPVEPSTQADDIDPIDPELARRLLATASITISSWRWKLRDAGYPFREPPGIDKLIEEIDCGSVPVKSKTHLSPSRHIAHLMR